MKRLSRKGHLRDMPAQLNGIETAEVSLDFQGALSFMILKLSVKPSLFKN
jgi:hypothetical protein